MVNSLLIFIARKLKISPLLAHILLMTLLTVCVGFANPSGWTTFADISFTLYWVVVCTIVVLITWITKGEYRKQWKEKDYWQENSDFF